MTRSSTLAKSLIHHRQIILVIGVLRLYENNPRSSTLSNGLLQFSLKWGDDQ